MYCEHTKTHGAKCQNAMTLTWDRGIPGILLSILKTFGFLPCTMLTKTLFFQPAASFDSFPEFSRKFA